MKMKILLLEHPRQIASEHMNDIANTPLSSCLLTGYVAGLLKMNGHEVTIVEGYLDNLTYTEIQNVVQAAKPDILGVHLVYLWQYDVALGNFLQAVREERNTCLVAYGFYPTVASAEVLQAYSALEAIIVGEPELTFSELAANFSAFAKDKGKSVAQISGLAVRRSEEISCLPRAPVTNLDRLPFPIRTPASYRCPEVNLLGSRGCYGACTFCYINFYYGAGSKWRGRTPENIILEIDRIIAETGAGRFYFTDPSFFGPGENGQQRARALAGLLKTRNIKFGIEGRANDLDEETIALLADAGLCQMLIGLESGRDESLRRMNKRTTVAQNERALAILKKHGVETNVGFIMFEPDASLPDVRENLTFLQRNNLLSNLPVTANVLSHHQIILQGTAAYRQLLREGRLVFKKESLYEGVALFADPKVAQLAQMMRLVTNFLFQAMSCLWDGKQPVPDSFRAANRLLVDLFTECLVRLERGDKWAEEEMEAIMQNSCREMEFVFLGNHRG